MLGRRDHLPLDPALPDVATRPRLRPTVPVPGQPGGSRVEQFLCRRHRLLVDGSGDVLAAPEQTGERPVHDLLRVVHHVDQLDIGVGPAIWLAASTAAGQPGSATHTTTRTPTPPPQPGRTLARPG